MIHLSVHLANEVRLGGPVQLRWMYSPEREMGTLKSYVRNRQHLEGCIAEARSVHDCINSCSRYLHEGIQTRFNRRPRNYDECGSSDVQTSNLFYNKGYPLGRKKGEPTLLDDKSRHQAHGYILNNCDEVQEYIREHELEVGNQGKGSKWSKARDHSQSFSRLFETRVMHEDVTDLIKQLSRGPNSIAKRYTGYIINGYRFHTRRHEVRHKTQNSGVTLVALTTSFASFKDKNPIEANITYYGKIVDILELDYYGHFKVVLFKCEWYETKEDIYGLTYVYFNKRCSQEEPFILASQAHQCFYVRDPYDDDKNYVIKIVPRDLFSMGDEVESDVPQSYINESSDHSMSPSIPEDNGEVDLVRNDIPTTIIKVYPHEFVAEQSEKESEDEYDIEDIS